MIGLVTARLVKVPTLVSDELRTFGASVVPVKLLALTNKVISVVPLKDTPFILRAVCNAVAVPALPVTLPLIVPLTVKDVIVALVAVKLVSVPTLVSEELRTFGASVVPVKLLALTNKVISVVPLKDTPFILRAVCNAVAVPALPVIVPVIGFVTAKLVNVPTLVSEELTTFGASVVPVKLLALTNKVISVVPLKDTPFILRAVCNAVAVPALPVIVPVIGFVTAKLVNVPTLVKEELTTLPASV
ncbi:MAG: hypothetical protein WC837_15360, partial [Bellilinea sp.]